jgi:hypothetical protein
MPVGYPEQPPSKSRFYYKKEQAMMKIIFIMIAIAAILAGCGNDSTSPFSDGQNGDEIISGGVPRDGIPAITSPDIISPSEATYMSNNDLVIGVVINGRARAYPVDILNYHEIVNDNLAGRSICVTYCPLTGSGIVFNSIIDGTPLEFGVSGLLFRNNLIPYDRTTESLYSQMFSRGIRGEQNNAPWPLIPSTRCTWGYWKSIHPDTDVMSRDTGYSKDYNSNPYGSYPANFSILFPVRFPDNSYHPKHLTLGIRSGEAALAVPASELLNAKVANLVFEDIPMAVFYDPGAEMMAAYSPVVGSDTLQFTSIGGPGVARFTDNASNSTWNSAGLAIEGELEGTRLAQIPYYTAYWFAWHDFYPETEVYQ